jgi:SAM-dependent methyltransferase
MKKIYLLTLLITKILFSKKYKKKKEINSDFKRQNVNTCTFCFSNVKKIEYYQFCRKYYIKYDICSCQNCGHGFILNPPDLDIMLNSYYSNDYYSRSIQDYEITNEKKYQFIKNYPIKNALEIGCMHGEFVEYLNNKGIDSIGCDIIGNPKFLKKEKYIQSDFLKINFNKKFDAIFSFANLEHIADPNAYIKKASNLLNKNGIIVIESVNFDSIVSKKLYHEDIPMHLNIFNLNSLKLFLNKNNLLVENVSFDLKNLYHDYSEGYFIYKILSFFNKKYTQNLKEKCNFYIPYERLEKMRKQVYNFQNVFYAILYITDYFLYKIFKPKLNYQFLLIAKKI